MPPPEENLETTVSGLADFKTTHWSAILAARQTDSPQAEEALAELCRTYWYPLYAYVRRRGHDVHEAQDLTQSFFAQILKSDFLRSVHPRKGRFRAFLLASIKNFLANERNRARTLKRGGQYSFLSWDAESIENRYRQEPAHELTPERIFERTWALTVLDEALDRLRNEYAAANKAELFKTLQVYLSGQDRESTYLEATAALGMSEGAVKMAVLRLRRRYGEMLRAVIAQTVANAKELDEEMRQLFAVLSC